MIESFGYILWYFFWLEPRTRVHITFRLHEHRLGEGQIIALYVPQCVFLNRKNWLHLQPLKKTPRWSDRGDLRCLLSKAVLAQARVNF